MHHHRSRPLLALAALAALLMAAPASARNEGKSAPPAPVLKVGQSVSGELKVGDRVEPDGTFYDVYAFDGAAGQTLTIEMTSRDMDSVLAFYAPGHEGPIALNDNADRRGRDARLQVVLPAAGRYLIVANAAQDGDTGHYKLSLREAQSLAVSRPKVRAIQPGKTVEGELSDRSGRAGDSSLYDLYRFRGKAGETVRVNLSSYVFEPYVSVHRAGQAADLGFARDQGQRAADLTVTLPADGDYEIWANAATAGQAGRYALWLGRADQTAQPEVRQIAYGDTIRGELTAADAKAGDNSFYDVYRFRASRGDEVTVTMRSGMVEAYLAVHKPGSAKPIATASDDGYGGRDAELSFVAPVDGVYEVWANTVSGGQRGLYVLSLEMIGRHNGEIAQNP